MEHKLTFTDYNEALKKNRLLGLRCQDCGAITVPPKLACSKCTSPSLEVVELSGTGAIKTFTKVHVPPEGRENEVPYIIVLVELDEGPWLMGNLAIDHAKTSMELIDKKVIMGHKIFPGDKYSQGESAGPLFRLTD